jgi:SAM-dependent methyltransferase
VTLPLIGRGHHVTALDVANRQLARCYLQARAAGNADLLATVGADMRDLKRAAGAHGPFDLVIAPFRALLHVADEAARVFEQAASVLRPGGRLAFDVFSPNADAALQFDGEWQLRRRVDDDGANGAWAIWERGTWLPEVPGLRLEVRCDPVPSDAERSRTVRMVLQTPAPQQWRSAIADAGLDLESVFGWFDERPLDPSSPDSVWVARRPD